MATNIVEEYIRARPGSHKLHEEAVKIFAANGATHMARVLDPFGPTSLMLKVHESGM